MKYIYFIIIIFISSCSVGYENEEEQIRSKCHQDSDCLKNEVCEGNYCISAEPEYSAALFSLEFLPENRLDNEKFTTKSRSNILLAVDVKTTKRFELQVKEYQEFSGKIISNEPKETSISYRFTIINKSTNEIYKTFYSYREGDDTFYYIKLVKGIDYIINVYPSKIYPTFTVSREILSVETVNVEKEVEKNCYINILGKLKLKVNNQNAMINRYTAYAYTNYGDKIQIISNKFICENKDKTCDFKLKILSTNKNDDNTCNFDLRVLDNTFFKITSDLDEYKNLEFYYPLNEFGELGKENQVELDLGNINKVENKKLTLSGNDSDLNNLKISVNASFHKYDASSGKYILNEYIKLKNKYTCLNKSCLSFNSSHNHIYQGAYNLFIEPSLDSHYASKFLNINLIENQTDINIELRNKKTINGILFTKESGPIEGSVEFTRKDNSLTNFKTIVNTDSHGNFSASLETGEYNILINPKNLNSISYSNWIYLNQRITENTSSLSYIVPRSYKVPIVVHSQGNNFLQGVRVIMHLHELEDAFELNDETVNKNNLPKSYPFNSFITDLYGKAIISIPIITED